MDHKSNRYIPRLHDVPTSTVCLRLRPPAGTGHGIATTSSARPQRLRCCFREMDPFRPVQEASSFMGKPPFPSIVKCLQYLFCVSFGVKDCHVLFKETADFWTRDISDWCGLVGGLVWMVRVLSILLYWMSPLALWLINFHRWSVGARDVLVSTPWSTFDLRFGGERSVRFQHMRWNRLQRLGV